MAAERAKNSNDESRRESRPYDPARRMHYRSLSRSTPHAKDYRQLRLPSSCCICINRRPGDTPAPDCVADFHMVDYG